MSFSKRIYDIEAGKVDKNYWRDLWRYRGLFYFLAWRDILVRYKQTLIGVTWALIQPLLMMIVFSVVFGKLANFPSYGVPYPILVFAGMLPWQFFALSFAESSNSLVTNSNMISKVYFPRLILPSSTIIVCLMDFFIASVLLIVLMLWYGFLPSRTIIFFPIFLLLACMTSLGAGLWVAALNVRYRDFRYVIPFVIQLGMYISPVGFVSNIIPEKWRMIYSINPLVGVIDGFRWSLLGDTFLVYWPGLVCSIVVITTLLISGFIFFRKTEKTFADII
ncbi:MAG TPA: ABC transporter permease [Gammaproteobacteria bacterium]|nr:ABC transporter permease [Gammaproteobacteria bacterium]